MLTLQSGSLDLLGSLHCLVLGSQMDLITLVTYLDGHLKHLLQPTVPTQPPVANHRSPILFTDQRAR